MALKPLAAQAIMYACVSTIILTKNHIRFHFSSPLPSTTNITTTNELKFLAALKSSCKDEEFSFV